MPNESEGKRVPFRSMYVALLRGVNVGGNRTVSMATLKQILESIGLQDVRTYINSGNVIFTAPRSKATSLAQRIEAAIVKEFGHPIRVLVLSRNDLAKIVGGLPATWVNDGQQRCDVMFLFSEVDRPDVVGELPVNASVEDVRYVRGAVFWRIDRKNVGRSRMSRIIGTKVYKGLTARNANTVRKLLELMDGDSAS